MAAAIGFCEDGNAANKGVRGIIDIENIDIENAEVQSQLCGRVSQ